MSNLTSTGSDVFNARDLAVAEVAARFLAPPVFERLLSRAHCILEGPRGSGKTTLLRMLTPEAFSLWRQHTPGPSIDFIGVFVPADVRWAKQLALKVERIPSELGKDAIQQAVFSVAVSLALIDTIQSCTDLQSTFGADHPDLFFKIDRSLQSELVQALSEVWQLPVSVPSFNGIRLSLRKRHNELSGLATRLAEGQSLSDVQGLAPYVTSTWLDNLVDAVETANDVLKRPNQLWAVLLDELEIVPQTLLRTIVEALRSTSNKVRFKLALSPTGSDLIPLGEPGNSSSFEDYRSLKLWYEKKGAARAFASQLFAAGLSRALSQEMKDADLVQAFGPSWSMDTLEEDESEDGEHDLEIMGPDSSLKLEKSQDQETLTPSLHRARSAAFARLFSCDESFRKWISDKKIDIQDLPFSDGSKNGTLVRKVSQIVIHRSYELQEFTGAAGAKRRGGVRNVKMYQGFPSIVDLTEGNPRWVLTLVEALVAASRASGNPIGNGAVQSVAIKDFVKQMAAKLMVYPTKSAATGRRWTPYDFVQALGRSIEGALFDGPFITDPRMSFDVDQASVDQFGEYIRTAIDLGALVIMRRGGPAPLIAGGDAQSLVGSRVRITYRLAPEFRLPLLYTKEQRMSAALRSGELLVQTEKGVEKKRLALPTQGATEILPIQGRLL
jgi:hypothetical protein